MATKSRWGVTLGLILLAAFICIVQITGCGSGSTSQSSTGTLKMSLSDKPSLDYRNLFIGIKEVRVVPAGYESAADSDPALPVVASYQTPLQLDVLTLKFLLQSLGEVQIPAGVYSQIRLILAENTAGSDPVNYLVMNSDPTSAKIPIHAPSSATSGLKINCNFEVAADSRIELVVDFDPNSSVVVTGNGKFFFKPAGIRVVEVKDLPPAFGYITGDLATYMPWETADVQIRPAVGGNAVANSTLFATYNGNSWHSPFSSYVPSGNYRVHVNSPGFESYSSPIATVRNGEETSMGVISFVPLPRGR